jgi:hypothetical protein
MPISQVGSRARSRQPEHVRQDHFKLTWPAWLPSDYYIGP